MSTASRKPAAPVVTYVPSGFFALRAPLLPLEALLEWSAEGHLPAGADTHSEEAAADRMRARLRRWVEDPVVREALFVASPSLDESLHVWLEAPRSERGQKVERTLVRYFARMSGRATPFGLFATHSVGRLAQRTQLRLGERSSIRKHTRLDMDYVCALVEQVRRMPEVRGALRYVPNSSLYRTLTQLRFLEMRQRGRERSYGLVGVETSPYLEATLERARAGATLAELAELLVTLDADISSEDARAYLEEVVESQVLVPTWAPTLTGEAPIPHLIAQASDIAPLAPVRERLALVQARLSELDAAGPGTAPESYRRVARELEPLPAPVELPRLFQVDALRPDSGLTISRRVTDELLRGVEALRRMTPLVDEGDLLTSFRDRFVKRYEGRPVPLLEALDEERGIGLLSEGRPGATTAPLLHGLPFGPKRGKGPRLDKRFGFLVRRLEETWRAGALELELTPEDVESMSLDESAVLPDAFGVQGTIVAASAEAVDRGDFRFVLDHVHGPSGAMLLGRFCHDDPELAERVREHLKAEEALRPDALFAEIVHLPQDRVGNVVCRPALREHDITFLGQSGLPQEQRIDVADLWLSHEDGRLVLRSRRWGNKEIIPRLTNAHNFALYGLGVYRFLCHLQTQGQRGLSFRWGPLVVSAFLPRVRYGRTVLSLARWQLERRRLKDWEGMNGPERFAAFQRFREQERLPRWVSLRDGDNVLPVDLDNGVGVEMLLHLLKGRGFVTLVEMYPGPGELCVEGREGHYVHELVVPFTRAATVLPAPRAQAPKLASTPRSRCFAPGSEWLYLKLYTGTASADRLLRTSLADTLRAVTASGAVDQWFFLRYRDPDHHLRLRLHGEPARLHAEAWPAMRAACEPHLEEGGVSRLQLDTYEREVERYGGPEGVLLAEELFAADSQAALELLQAYEGDAGAELRWRMVLKGLDALLEELGLGLESKLAVVGRLRASFGAEFSLDKDKRLEEQLGLRFRRERRGLESLLAATGTPKGPWQAGLLALQRRGLRVRGVAERLKLASQAGRLTRSLEELAESFLHMQVNRMLPGDQRAQELVLYDFLARLYRSRQARGAV